jgi:hypothetical protein
MTIFELILDCGNAEMVDICRGWRASFLETLSEHNSGIRIVLAFMWTWAAF